MPARPNPVVLLAEQVVAALRAARDRAGRDYPLTLERLARLTPTGNLAEVRARAFKHKSFTAHVCLVQKKHPDSPVALAEDSEHLASSPLVLGWLLDQLCTPEAPAVALDKLARKVDAPIRESFREAVLRQVADGTLPDFTGVTTIKNKPHLFLKRMPPPKPPDVALAE